MKPNERIICALDLPEAAEARRMMELLDSVVDFFKVGMLLYLIDGQNMVRWLLEQGKKVFLDLKFYDVHVTFAPPVERATDSGVHLLTVHVNPEILQMAGPAAAGTDLRVLSVTVLTSLDATDIEEMGFPCSLSDLVERRTGWAIESGCAGLVASPREAALLRKRYGQAPLIVTPGIRPAGSSMGTHKRAATPAEAVQAGSDYLVIGQPIIRAADPRAAAQRIAEEIAGAQG